MSIFARSATLTFVLLTTSVLACGPHFPKGYVWDGSGEAMLDWPRTSFKMELSRYVGLPIPEAAGHGGTWAANTLTKDRVELEAHLFEAGEDVWTVLAVSEDYARLRESAYRRPGPQHETPATPYSTPVLDAYLPAEFAMYAEGARLFHGRDYAGATAAWESLLTLAPEERCHRSVWAAYMLGMTWLKRDAEIAPRHFEQAIVLAEEGFSDSLDLATLSRYMLGRIAEWGEDYAAAIHGYLDYMKCCEPFERTGGFRAIERIASRIFRESTFDFTRLSDNESLNVLAMWANSQDPWESRRWLEALKTMTPTREIQGAERMACSAYYAGDIATAEAWLKYADKKAPHGRWLRAKLLARAGKMAEAEAILASLEETFSGGYVWTEHSFNREPVEARQILFGDLGTCRLNRGAYAGALEAFIRGGYEEDAAYVADRVLTTSELKAFVKKSGEAPWMLARADVRYGREDLTQGQTVKYLLARRLARQGSMKEAESHFPDVLSAREGYWSDSSLVEQGDLKVVIRRLSEDLRAANDGARSLELRAQSLMDAAWITRKWGLRLYGSAHAPDMEVFGGMYEFSTDPRTKSNWASNDERRRVAASAPVPDRRHHYRWRAADLLWKASKLLPDNDERTARALWEGGRLLANRDPGGADKFYKALVNRCRNLPIGQEADRLRWFPPRPDAWEEPNWAGELVFE